jgi:hypothetical protein
VSGGFQQLKKKTINDGQIEGLTNKKETILAFSNWPNKK